MDEDKDLLVACDIVNPFTKNIKMLGLKEIIKRCNDCNCYDKVGEWFYTIEKTIQNNETFDQEFVNYVVEWLNYLDSLKGTKKTINFTLDLSK